jgi:hypothetical protein
VRKHHSFGILNLKLGAYLNFIIWFLFFASS